MLVLINAVAMAGITWLGGWWAIPVLALCAGRTLRARDGEPRLVALAAVLAWGALLLVDAAGGRFGELSAVLGGVLGVPAPALVVVTLLFAALLGWSGAVVGCELGRLLMRERV
jgi:hypothetical protein